MFVVGSAMFMVAFVLAAGRSRDEQVTMAGVIWLSGAAPVRTARAFRVLLGLQVVVAVAAASIRPFTAVAFGILAPMYGLGTMALHAARKGDFAPIVVGERKSASAPGSDHARTSASDDSATGADDRRPKRRAPESQTPMPPSRPTATRTPTTSTSCSVAVAANADLSATGVVAPFVDGASERPSATVGDDHTGRPVPATD